MRIVHAEGLHVRFGANEVLRGIDLHADKGETLAVIGPSGSGKTTLLRCLDCLEPLSAGRLEVAGIAIDGARPLARQRRQIAALRRRVGFVFQNFNLFPHRTALQNVTEGPIVVGRETRDKAAADGRALLAKVGLQGREDQYPAQLSGGQQQRVAIARALAMRPEVILFDEPTSALDPELVGEVLATIRALAEERRTMIIVTHEMRFARDVADRAIFIDQGMIAEQGPAAQVLGEPREGRTRRFLAKFLDG